MMRKIRLAAENLNLAVGYVCGLGILAMGLILFYEVIRRYFFNSPTSWVQEAAVYIYGWTMLAGSAYTLMKGKHVRIDLIIERMPAKFQLVLDAGTSAIGAIFCAVVAWQAWEMVMSSVEHHKVSPTLLRLPQWIPQTALLVGFTLLTLQFIFIMCDRFIAMRGREEETL
ncbi:hypothetical protein FACS1894216_00050 [Synergistales bacterium]|nr:hypothetical protein FACS1894216_00050 [Synergistales bacterium]